jgi:hypothetical protein
VREEGRDDATSPRVSASSSGEVAAQMVNSGDAPVGLGGDGDQDKTRATMANS